MRRRMEMVTIGGIEREMEVVVDEMPRLRADGAALARILRHVADRVERHGTCWDTLAIAQAAIDRADRSERQCHADGGKWWGWTEPQDLHRLGAGSLVEIERRWERDEAERLREQEGGEE